MIGADPAPAGAPEVGALPPHLSLARRRSAINVAPRLGWTRAWCACASLPAINAMLPSLILFSLVLALCFRVLERLWSGTREGAAFAPAPVPTASRRSSLAEPSGYQPVSRTSSDCSRARFALTPRYPSIQYESQLPQYRPPLWTRLTPQQLPPAERSAQRIPLSGATRAEVPLAKDRFHLCSERQEK